MLSRSKFLLLLFSCMLVCLYGCEKKADKFSSNSNEIIIDSNFTAENISGKLLYSKDTSLINADSISTTFIQQHFIPNKNDESLRLGLTNKLSNVWISFKLINKTSSPQSLVIYSTRLRLDEMTGYILKNNSVNIFGYISKKEKLTRRYFTNYDLSIPLQIQPNDSNIILLKTNRSFGIYETTLKVFKQPDYLSNALSRQFSQFFQFVFCGVLAFFMLCIGLLYKHKAMLYYSFFIFAISLITFATSGYSFSIFSSSPLGVQGNNIELLFTFFSNILWHPFGYELAKKVLLNKQRYRRMMFLLTGSNALFILLFFLPKQLFNSLNALIVYGAVSMILLNMVWIIYYAIVAYRRKGVRWYLYAALFAYVPLIIISVVSLFGRYNLNLIFNFDYYGPLFVDTLFAYLSFCLLRDEITLKQLATENMNKLKVDLENIRKNEIEHIGRNLHDEVGNTLASALGYLGAKKINTETVNSIILQAVNELRFLSHNLVKNEDKPLTEKTEDLISRFNDFSAIDFIYNDYSNAAVNKLPLSKQQSIYIILLELMTNIIKHSQSQVAQVQFFSRDQQVEIIIEDDGIGFNTDKQYLGIGIKNIKERAAVSELELMIDSTPNGTIFIIKTAIDES